MSGSPVILVLRLMEIQFGIRVQTGLSFKVGTAPMIILQIDFGTKRGGLDGTVCKKLRRVKFPFHCL